MHCFLSIEVTSPDNKFFLKSLSIRVGGDAVVPNQGWNGRHGISAPKGVVALAALLLRYHLEANQKRHSSRSSLIGGKTSLAKSLYSATYENVAWPGQVSSQHDGLAKCITKHSSNGMYTVELNAKQAEFHLEVTLQGIEISHKTDLITTILKQLDPSWIPDLPPIRLGAIGSAKLSYIRDSYNAFLEKLSEFQTAIDPDPPAEHFGNGKASPLTEMGAKEWHSHVEHLLKYRMGGIPPDYWIAVGSQAAIALKNYYGEAYGTSGRCPPIIFLGVTYPVGLHLVDSLHSRTEDRQVCGVVYGADGLSAIVSMIYHRIVPGCRIRFIYFEEYPQDVEAAKQIRQTRLFQERIVEVFSATRETLLGLLGDEEIVYVSWYSFEAVFEEGTEQSLRIVEVLKKRKVVSTTHVNCRDGLAFAACCADDREIGMMAACLLQDFHAGNIAHLGTHDVVIPRLRYWLNETQAMACGIDQFSAETRRGAQRIYAQCQNGASETI